MGSLDGLPTIKTESVDFVRMSCLGTSVPEAEWPIILAEVRRILKTGGVVEIIDDELCPAYSSEEQKKHGSHSPSRSTYRNDLHPVDRYFRQMLVDRYGMPEIPHRTIDAAVEIVFGANDKKEYPVQLPLPDFKIVGTEEMRRGGSLFQAFRVNRDTPQPVPHTTPAKAQRVLGLDSVSVGHRSSEPFLIFHQHGLCPLEASEVRMAACGSMHRVLSCRASLIDYIVGSGMQGERLDEITNMLWAYERRVPNPSVILGFSSSYSAQVLPRGIESP